MHEMNKVTVQEDYLKSLEKSVEDLKTLMEVSAAISSTLDFNELMTVVMEKAKNVMDAEACSILLYNEKTDKLEFEVALCRDESASDILKKKITLDRGQGIAGHVAESLEPLLIEDAQHDTRFFCGADEQTGFVTKSLIALPLIGRNGLIGVAEILNPLKKKSFDNYDLEMFQALCRQVAVAIENSLLHKESVERERHRQELEFAATLQRSFLPESPVFRKGKIIASAINMAAKHVGGDLYDFIEPVEGKTGVFIGDISGKGMPAALYMAKIISDFRYSARNAESPESVMNFLNADMAKAPRGMFLTATYMIIDENTGELKLSSAGHPPFLWLTGQEVKVMDFDSGPPLGIMSLDYSAENISLNKGDRLILLTDGVFEAKNREGSRLGFESLIKFVKEHYNEEDIIDFISEHVKSFSRGVDMADDITLVEIRFAG